MSVEAQAPEASGVGLTWTQCLGHFDVDTGLSSSARGIERGHGPIDESSVLGETAGTRGK